MAIKIDKKIKGFAVQGADDKARAAEPAAAPAPVAEAPRRGAEVIQMHEQIERPEVLVGSTYKIKSPLFEHALEAAGGDEVAQYLAQLRDVMGAAVQQVAVPELCALAETVNHAAGYKGGNGGTSSMMNGHAVQVVVPVTQLGGYAGGALPAGGVADDERTRELDLFEDDGDRARALFVTF